MKTPSIWLPTFLVWVIFVTVDLIGGSVLPLQQANRSHVLAWSFGANAIVAITLTFLASHTFWRKWRLALTLSTVPLVITVINLIEGIVFLNIPQPAWIITLLVIKYALTLPLWLIMFHQSSGLLPGKHSIPMCTFGGKFWRFAFCNFSYLILYITAGLIIFPLVHDFYATQSIPSFDKIIALQLLVRGPVFTGICILLSNMIGPQRPGRIITVGLAFALLSVAPLVVPNPLFPDTVRWVHFCEITSSNFVFGILVALIWSKNHLFSNQ